MPAAASRSEAAEGPREPRWVGGGCGRRSGEAHVDLLSRLAIYGYLALPKVEDEGGDALPEHDGRTRNGPHGEHPLQNIAVRGLEVGDHAGLAGAEVGEG